MFLPMTEKNVGVLDLFYDALTDFFSSCNDHLSDCNFTSSYKVFSTLVIRV
jgi:hypothetical protein